MTTIAFDGKTLASDSCWTGVDYTIDTLTSKIERLPSGALLGLAGQNDGRAVRALFEKVKTPAQLPSYDAIMAVRASTLGLIVLPKGRVYKVSTTITSPDNWEEGSMGDVGLWEINGAFTAVGSGGCLAMLAMECGKSAREAVRMACKYDPNSRGPVHAIDLKASA